MRRSLVAACLAFLVASCSGADPVAPKPVGTLSVTMQSEVIGADTFSVSGAFYFDNAVDGAGGFYNLIHDSYTVEGVKSRGNHRYDDVFIQFPATGTFDLTACDPIDVACPKVSFTPYADHTTNYVVVDLSCRLTSGQLSVTSISSTRITGTFAGSGICGDAFASKPFTATNGSFDVPILTGTR